MSGMESDPLSAVGHEQPSPSSTTFIPLQSISMHDLTRLVSEAVRTAMEAERGRAEPGPAPGESRRAAAAAAALAQHEEDEKETDRERQRHAIRTSRASVSNLLNEAVHITFNQPSTHYSTPMSSPLRPRPPVQSKAAVARRLSDGFVDEVPDPPAASVSVAAPGPVTVKVSVEVERMTGDQFRRYESTAKQLSNSVAKFHGERVKDGDRTVDEFVELVNTEMDAWLSTVQQHGRLNLVIGRTSDTAQNWLVKKRLQMQQLFNAGVITDRALMEWSEVQGEFISEMSKGVTSAVYEQQLRALRIRDKDGRLDVAAFVRRFDQICARLYPSARFTSDSDRSWRLGEKFDERLTYCGEAGLRDACLNMMIARRVAEKDRTVEQWQDVLQDVASTAAYMHPVKVNPPKDKAQLPKKQSTWPSKQSVSAVSLSPSGTTSGDEDSTSQSDDGRPEGAQVAVTSAAAGKVPRNPHISPEQVKLLLEKRVCLACYKRGHHSRNCPAPANKGPTEAELKASAGQ
jgi:hypothetical protein